MRILQGLGPAEGAAMAGAAMIKGVAAGARLSGTKEFAKLSVDELKTIIKQNGGVDLLNSKGLFGSGVPGAKKALEELTSGAMKLPEGLTVEALQAYREIAVRNPKVEVQQIRLQIVDKALEVLGTP